MKPLNKHELLQGFQACEAELKKLKRIIEKQEIEIDTLKGVIYTSIQSGSDKVQMNGVSEDYFGYMVSRLRETQLHIEASIKADEGEQLDLPKEATEPEIPMEPKAPTPIRPLTVKKKATRRRGKK